MRRRFPVLGVLLTAWLLLVEVHPCRAEFSDAERGLELDRLRQYVPAIKHLNIALQKDPHNELLLFHRGNCLLKTHDFKAAIKDFTAAIALHKDEVRYYSYRASCYLMLHQYHEAVADLTVVLEHDRHDAHALEQRATAYEALHQPLLAGKDRAVLTDGTLALVKAAKKAQKEGRSHDAYRYLERAQKINADEPEVYLVRGNLYKDDESFTLAIKDFQRAIKLAPKMVNAHFGLALCYESLSQSDKALASFAEVIKLDPKNKGVHRRRAEVYEGMKQFSAAADELTKQLVVDRDVSGNVLFKRAQMYKQLKDYPKALADYNTLVKHFPEDEDAFRFKAQVEVTTGKLQEALLDFSSAIKLDPESASLYRSRAEVYRALGKADLQAADLKTADSLK